MDDYIKTVKTLESLDAYSDIVYVVNRLRDILIEVVKELDAKDDVIDTHLSTHIA